MDVRYTQAHKKLIQVEQGIANDDDNNITTALHDMVELQKVMREKEKLIDENEQLQQTTEMLTINYEKEKQVRIILTMFIVYYN